MPYTGKESRIILSFANRGGGDLFAHWLRDRLMKDLDYYSDNAVFLDNVASRNAEGGTVEAHNMTGATFDIKDNITTSDGSYLSIGAQNPNWLEMWETALSQAKVLIQIQTPEYFTSEACATERAKISKKLKGNNKLVLLAITVDHTLPRMVLGLPRTTPMQLTKIPGTSLPQAGDNQSPVRLLKGSWVIGETDFKWVSDFVKANGCRVGA